MEQRQSSGEHALTERKIKTVVAAICFFIIVIVVLYFVNFNYKFSHLNADWGTLGDYFGGLLNPVIAGAALYFLIESYKLQKAELKAARELLNDSASAQKKQVNLAALTALLNSNLEKISFLQHDKAQWANSKERLNDKFPKWESENISKIESELSELDGKIWEIEQNIQGLQKENQKLEERICSIIEDQS